MTKEIRILVVEDSDAKFAELETLLKSAGYKGIVSERAATITDAEFKIESEEWFAIILDISMDITKSAAGPRLGGHATLGGLGIATKMFLLGREAPTIIVTAFDSFQAIQSERAGYEVLGLEDVERRAADTLGKYFIGCVRYGERGWQEKFIKYLEAIAQ
jgi:CheY-like chemotaxis protein